MAHFEALLNDVMGRALGELEQKQFALYTLAFYLDHESSAVSVCADTQPNSDRVVAGINNYNLKHFLAAVREGDLASAALWQANVGRSLSLGDFTAVNLARTELGDVPADATLCRGGDDHQEPRPHPPTHGRPHADGARRLYARRRGRPGLVTSELGGVK